MAQAKPEVVRFSASTWVGIVIAIGGPTAAGYVMHDRAIAKHDSGLVDLDRRLTRIEVYLDSRSTP